MLDLLYLPPLEGAPNGLRPGSEPEQMKEFLREKYVVLLTDQLELGFRILSYALLGHRGDAMVLSYYNSNEAAHATISEEDRLLADPRFQEFLKPYQSYYAAAVQVFDEEAAIFNGPTISRVPQTVSEPPAPPTPPPPSPTHSPSTPLTSELSLEPFNHQPAPPLLPPPSPTHSPSMPLTSKLSWMLLGAVLVLALVSFWRRCSCRGEWTELGPGLELVAPGKTQRLHDGGRTPDAA